jgi:hypothetical protein
MKAVSASSIAVDIKSSVRANLTRRRLQTMLATSSDAAACDAFDAEVTDDDLAPLERGSRHETHTHHRRRDRRTWPRSLWPDSRACGLSNSRVDCLPEPRRE